MNDQILVDKINSLNSSWKAKLSGPKTVMRGALIDRTPILLSSSGRLPVIHRTNSAIPKEFDARKVWPNCPTIDNIYNQGACGSCWAVSTAAAITDRICIATNGSISQERSSQQLVSCIRGHCDGGSRSEAWSYWVEKGLVTSGCQAYVSSNKEMPSCSEKCASGYHKSFEEDLVRGRKVYSIQPSVEQIQLELMLNGPLATAFNFCHDFQSYASGVYRHLLEGCGGSHAVKLIGWDEQDGTPYWLIANSWGQDWGDKGFVKFLRGDDHLKIESSINTVGVY